MVADIEDKCKQKGVRLTDQRKLIAKTMSESENHPDVDELHKKVSKFDSKISIATVYRTVKLFEEAGIVSKHDFKGNKSRYEQAPDEHHDHLPALRPRRCANRRCHDPTRSRIWTIRPSLSCRDNSALVSPSLHRT